MPPCCQTGQARFYPRAFALANLLPGIYILQISTRPPPSSLSIFRSLFRWHLHKEASQPLYVNLNRSQPLLVLLAPLPFFIDPITIRCITYLFIVYCLSLLSLNAKSQRVRACFSHQISRGFQPEPSRRCLLNDQSPVPTPSCPSSQPRRWLKFSLWLPPDNCRTSCPVSLFLAISSLKHTAAQQPERWLTSARFSAQDLPGSFSHT